MTEPRSIIKVIKRIKEMLPQDTKNRNLKASLIQLDADLNYLENCARFRAPEVMYDLWAKLSMALAHRLSIHSNEEFVKNVKLLMKGKIQ